MLGYRVGGIEHQFMHFAGVLLLSTVALFWVAYGLRVARGTSELPRLDEYAPATDANCPAISLVFAARDEEEKLPLALGTLKEIDYPRLEIRCCK
jgi:hypothetical protein